MSSGETSSKETFAEYKRRLRSGSESIPAESISSQEGEAFVEEGPIQNFKEYIGKMISRDFPKLLDALVNKCIMGSLSHLKYLFELGGVKEEMERQGEGGERLSIAEVLMAAIRSRPSTDADEQAERLGGDSGANAR
jgi:hypothetical protein